MATPGTFAGVRASMLDGTSPGCSRPRISGSIALSGFMLPEGDTRFEPQP